MVRRQTTRDGGYLRLQKKIQSRPLRGFKKRQRLFCPRNHNGAYGTPKGGRGALFRQPRAGFERNNITVFNTGEGGIHDHGGLPVGARGTRMEIRVVGGIQTLGFIGDLYATTKR